MKRTRHYKRVDNALNKLFYQRIYIPKHRDTTSGHVWLNGWASHLIRNDLDKPCTAEYDSFRELWTLTIGR